MDRHEQVVKLGSIYLAGTTYEWPSNFGNNVSLSYTRHIKRGMELSFPVVLWGLVVSRSYLVEHGAFSPEDLTAIIGAFEDCLLSLGLTKRSDPVTLEVAKRIIDLAKSSRDVSSAFLRDQVLQSFKNVAA